VEYLAAPYDPRVDTPQSKPWAAKRYAQGQARPWADEFSAINFEVSNETWNWLFAPWVFEGMTDGATRKQYERGEVYGMFNEHVISCLAKSPYWTSSGLDKKTKFVLGGWVADRNRYGNMAALHSPRATYNTIAAYNGGWDEGEGPTTGDKDSLWRTLLQVAHIGTDRSVELLQDRDKMRAEGKATFELGTYEAGPGYALSGLNGQAQMTPDEVLAQERTMKSLAAGTATLDCFLDKAYYGHKLQNFFTFHVGGTHWVSHAPWYKGAVASPPWMMMELFNTQGTGSFLKTEAMSTPTADAPKWNGRPEKKDIPLVACYATRSGSRVNVFVLSRKVANYPDTADAGFTPVTLRLPFSAAAKVTVYKMAGDPAAHNLDGEVVKVTSAAVPADAFKQEFVLDAARGADARGLPPGATFLYVFEGTNVPAGKDVSPVPAAVTAKNAR
jgi:hypothetical protein